MAESPLALLVVLRFIHVLAAALWVGGGIVVLAARSTPNVAPLSGMSSAALGRTVGRLVGTGFAVFVLTGALLTFNRLAEQSIDAAYVAVLAAKVLLALAMFRLAVPRRRRDGPTGRTLSQPALVARAHGLDRCSRAFRLSPVVDPERNGGTRVPKRRLGWNQKR